jgi:glycosyltransferase involved in cell wall biosynthesis
VIALGQPDRLGDPSGVAAALQGDPRGCVAILLCTFNGARFLPLQLASFEAQDFPDWRLFVSDDGSTDGTLALLEDFRRKHGADRVQIRHGPEKGAAANFMSLICDPALDSAFYALSDQDDVWAANKLSRARSFLTGAAADAPSLYCSRVRMIDENGAEIGLTPIHKKHPHFRNALVQNIAIGNTVAFNEKTRRLLMQAGADANAAVHDWWIYLVTTAVGGRVFYDPFPSVDYRIHGGNLIGANNSRVRKAQMLLNRFKGWSDLNVRALERIESVMLAENRATFELFRRSRTLSLLPRLYGLLRCGVYRDAILDNVGLLAAALAGKI